MTHGAIASSTGRSRDRTGNDEVLGQDISLKATASTDEGSIIAAALEAMVPLLGERASCVMVQGRPRVVCATHAPSLHNWPIELERYPEITRALRTRKAIAVGDVRRDPLMAPVLGLLPPQLGAVVAVPLLDGARALGVFLVKSSGRRWFRAAELAQGMRIATAAGQQLGQVRRSSSSTLPRAIRNGRILLAQDEASQARGLARLLECAGHEVAIVDDGAAVVTRARQAPPDLVILDVCLPSVDGLTAARRLLADPMLSEIPVLFLSACDDPMVRVEALALGASDYLTRPFFAAELGARIDHLLAAAEARRSWRGQARVDALTGVGNLRELRERLGAEVSRAARHRTPLVVVMLDVDRLKQINDQWGHEAGSRALAAVGRVLTAETRAIDTAARYGGDEFVVLLPHATLAEGVAFAERVLSRLRAVELDGPRLSVSAGVAGCATVTATSGADLLSRADAAAYQAKRAGGDCVRAAGREEPQRQVG